MVDGEKNPSFLGVVEPVGEFKKEFLLYHSSFEAIKESTAKSIGEIEAFESTMKDLDANSSEYRDKLEKYKKMIHEMHKFLQELIFLRSYIIDLVCGGPNAIENIDPVSREKNRKEVFKDFEYSEFLLEIDGLLKEVSSVLRKPSWMIENEGGVYNISDLSIDEKRDMVRIQVQSIGTDDFDPGLAYQESREGKDYIGRNFFEKWIAGLKKSNMSGLRNILGSLKEIMDK